MSPPSNNRRCSRRSACPPPCDRGVTVFAPTNDAFAKIPKETLDTVYIIDTVLMPKQ
ncbi:fasciclin domain-containing protein [Streptosporangium sp. H16]|uniref:fasciclin domain-containing protein n=1 Tax=Streptosporangium sp. H16 TaxID=3444184 RepID=UPI003F793716